MVMSMSPSGRVSPGEDLVRQTRSLQSLLQNPALGQGFSNEHREQVLSAADVLLTQATAVEQLPEAEVALARLDTAQLVAVLRDAEEPAEVKQRLCERFVEDARRVAAAAQSATSAPASAPPSVPSDVTLIALADDYGHDANRERSAAGARRVFACVLLVAALISVFWAVRLAQDAANGHWIPVVGPLFLAVASGLGAVVLMRAAAVHDRAAREYTRLQRGIAGIEAYLAPLPPQARHLLRATMTQVLFPRLLEDDDPLREPQWPDQRTLMYAVNDVPPPNNEVRALEDPESAPPQGAGGAGGDAVGP